jgi:hypothetical protein
MKAIAVESADTGVEKLDTYRKELESPHAINTIILYKTTT